MPQQASKRTNMSPRSMESAYEFARTGKAARLICTAFHKFLQSVKDPRQTSRLTSKLSEIIKTDTLHGRGERTIGAGDVGLLEGFDFCITQQLQRLLMVPLTATIDRATGLCTVPLPPFTPKTDMHITGNVTHIQVCAAAAELNFERERFVTDLQQSEALPLDEPIHLELHPSIPQDSRKTILVAVGIKLLQVVNGREYEMSGTRAAFHIVKAEGEVWSEELGVGSVESRVGSSEAGVGSAEAGVRSSALGVGSRVSKPKSGTGGRKPEVSSRKPEVRNQRSERPKTGKQKRVTGKQGKASTGRKASGTSSTSITVPSVVKLKSRGKRRLLSS